MLERKKSEASFASRLSENENSGVDFHLRSVQDIILFFQFILPRFYVSMEHRKPFENLLIPNQFQGKILIRRIKVFY